MDNLCHTLTGAALGYAGLRHKTRLASATLMIAANLPDLDVLVFATDTPSIAFRRGWTHGVLAQLLLPVALTGVMLLVDRLRGGRDAAVSDADDAASGLNRKRLPLHAGWLLLLSYIGIYSHVFLDFLNTYGVRLLTPFDWRWFYGDTLFIIDPWLWLAFGAGIWLSARRRSPAPARVALTVGVVYIAAMLISARAARDIVVEAWREAHGGAPRALMVGPVPIDPFNRQIIVDAGTHYETGGLDWLPSPRVTFSGRQIPKNDDRPAVVAARAQPPLRSFLIWSRFPFYVIEEDADGTRVSVGDMRFSLDNPLRDAIGRGRFTATTVIQRGDR